MLFRALCLNWLYVPFQWVLLRDQGLSATELLGLNTVFCIAAVAFEVPTGVMADWWGRRTLFVVGCLVSLWASLGFALAFASATADLGLLAGANVLAALSMCCISGADSAYLFELFQWSDREQLYRCAEAWTSALRWVVAALAAGGASLAVAGGLPWASLYGLTGVVAVVAALIALTLTEPWRTSQSITSTAAGGPHRELVRRLHPGAAVRKSLQVLITVTQRRELWALALFSATFFPALRLGLFVDAPFLLHLGLRPDHLGWVYGTKDVVAAVAAAGTAAALARWGEHRLLLFLAVAVAVALIMMAFMGPLAWVWVAVPTAAFGLFSPVVRTYINRRVDSHDERAALLSTEGMARRLGFAALSPLVGLAIDLWSLTTALVLTAAWTGTSLLVAWLWLRPPGGPTPAAPTKGKKQSSTATALPPGQLQPR
jgi:MFS family permease